MKVRTPYYYKEFKCIGGECIDTCCAGWEVDVDKESSAYYKSVEGEFGDRLRRELVDLPIEDQFKLRPNGRCPFLNDCNLCDIYTELGEDALCDTCTNFPRHITEFGDTVEIGISLSCPVACRLIMGKEEPISFVEETNDEKLTHYNDIDANLYFVLLKARRVIYSILVNRDFSVNDRIALVLTFAKALEKNIKKTSKVDELIAEYSDANLCEKMITELSAKYSNISGDTGILKLLKKPKYYGISRETAAKNYFEWLKVYSELEHIKVEWPPILKELNSFLGGDYISYSENCDAEIEYEHLCMYYTFRYFLRGAFDGKIYEKTGLLAVAYLMQKLLDLNNLHETGHCDFEDRIRLMRFYSKETEHSEENLEALFKAIGSNRYFSYESIMGLLFVK